MYDASARETTIRRTNNQIQLWWSYQNSFSLTFQKEVEWLPNSSRFLALTLAHFIKSAAIKWEKEKQKHKLTGCLSLFDVNTHPLCMILLLLFDCQINIFFGEFNSNVWLCLRIIQWCVSCLFIQCWNACKLFARKISYSLKMFGLELATMRALWHIHFRQIHKNKRQNGLKTEEIWCRTKCFMYFVKIPTILLFIFQHKSVFYGLNTDDNNRIYLFDQVNYPCKFEQECYKDIFRMNNTRIAFELNCYERKWPNKSTLKFQPITKSTLAYFGNSNGRPCSLLIVCCCLHFNWFCYLFFIFFSYSHSAFISISLAYSFVRSAIQFKLKWEIIIQLCLSLALIVTIGMILRTYLTVFFIVWNSNISTSLSKMVLNSYLTQSYEKWRAINATKRNAHSYSEWDDFIFQANV